MAKIIVNCEINDYSEPSKTPIKVHSHWGVNKFVVLEVNGERYTVCGNELITAVENAMNTNA